MVITTDSGSNPRYMDTMIPCVITDSNNKEYSDMIKLTDESAPAISNEEVFKRALSGEKFRTASPAIGDFAAIMKPHLEAGEDIIHLSMSSGISAGSYNASRIVAEGLNEQYGEGRVTAIDTLTGGVGGTIINDYANNLVYQGVPKETLINELENVKKRVLTAFYIPSVSGFVKSGRAPKGLNVSDKLGLRYRIDVNESGKLVPRLRPLLHGGIEPQFMRFLEEIINDKNKEDYDPNFLALAITSLKKIDVERIKGYLYGLNYFDPNIIDTIPFYGAISSYGVEDQVGIALIKRHEKI